MTKKIALGKIAREYFEVIVLLLVGFLVVTWFRGDFLINPGDTNFSFYPQHDLLRSLFIWDHHQGLGTLDSMASAKIFPYNLLLAFLSAAGISIYLSQKILFYLIFASSGLSAYFLARHLFALNPYRRIAAFVCANLYMMNPYLIQLRWGSGYIMGLFFYALLPLVFLMWLRGIETKDIKYGIYMVLISLLTLPSLNNPAYSAPILIICGLDLLLRIILNRGNGTELRAIGKIVAATLAVFILVFAFWIVSIVIPLAARFEGLMKSTVQFKQDVITSTASSIINLLRNWGDWGFWGNYRGELYYPYSPAYSSPLFILIGFTITMLVALPIVSLSKYDKATKYRVMLFAFIFVAGVWLSKGIHAPGGKLYDWMLFHIPFGLCFRAAYEKFGALISFSTAILAAYAFDLVLRNLRSNAKRLTVCVIVLVGINIYMFPFWTGDIWRSQTRILGGMRFRIPREYRELQQWLEQQNTDSFRILQLPDNAAAVPGIVSLSLDGVLYTASDPLNRMLTIPSVYLNPFDFSMSENLTSRLYRDYSWSVDGFIGKLGGISRLLNIRLILLRGDASNITYTDIRDPREVEYSLRSLPMIRSFGKLALYAVPGASRASPVYASAATVIVCGDNSTLLPLMEADYCRGNVVFVPVTELEKRPLRLDDSMIRAVVFDMDAKADALPRSFQRNGQSLSCCRGDRLPAGRCWIMHGKTMDFYVP